LNPDALFAGGALWAEFCVSVFWQTAKIVLRLIWRALLCLSFGAMIALGLLMAYGLVPGIRGGRMAEVIEWSDFARSASDGSLGKIFFSLAAINLVLVWG
jgi:hypothetical protein